LSNQLHFSDSDVWADSLPESKSLPLEILKAAIDSLPNTIAQTRDGKPVLSSDAAAAYREVVSTDFSKTSWRIDDEGYREIIALWTGLGGSFISDFSSSPEEARIFAWVLSPVPEAAQFALKHLKGRDGRWVPTSLLATEREFLSWLKPGKEIVNRQAVSEILDCGPVGFRFRARQDVLPTYFMLREFDGFRAQAILPGRSKEWARWLEQFAEKTGHKFAGITSANLSDLGREVRSGGTHKDLAELQADMGHLGIPILSGPIALGGQTLSIEERSLGYKSLNSHYSALTEFDREKSTEIAPISTSLLGFTEDESCWELLRHGSVHEIVLSRQLEKHGVQLSNCTQGRLELSQYVGDLVAAFPLFSELESDQVAEISQMIEMRQFSAGETIIVEGDKAEKIFFIASGSVNVAIEQGIILQSGNFFGEISLIEGTPRTATVIGNEAGVLLTLDAHIIYRLMEFLPTLADSIREMARDRLAQA
jgi:hypothetical protein